MAATDRGFVHVDLGRLDRLLHLVGDLVLARSSLVDQMRRARRSYGFKEQVLELIEATEHTSRICDQIQSKVMQARLVPIANVFRRFGRLVEEVSRTKDKQIELELVGERTEVDKRTIDELVQPLVHLVRNSLDHGIEPAGVRRRAGKPEKATLTLEARHEGNRLVVCVRDDGAGVNLDAVRRKAAERGLCTEQALETMSEDDVLELLFRPGFSTAERVTGLSGRGVGMDAARHRVQALGGRLEFSSVPGQGTSTRIELPLTTAIVTALTIVVGDETYALPLEHVVEVLRVEPAEIRSVDGREQIDLRGQSVTLLRLAAVLGAKAVDAAPGARLTVVVVRHGAATVALAIERVHDRGAIVIQGLSRRLARIPGVVGASVGVDGGVMLVLDVATLCVSTQQKRGAKP